MAGAIDPALVTSESSAITVPIPIARGPNDAPQLAPSVSAQTRAARPAASATQSVATTAPAPSAGQPAASQSGGRSVQSAAPAPRIVQPANIALPPTPRSLATPQAPHDLQMTTPRLIGPPADARLSGVVDFEWRPVSELPHGAAYENVVWSPEQDPGQARGIAAATIMTAQQVNLDPLFESGPLRTGNLYWTILIVQREPYLRLTAPGDGEARYLVRRTGS